MTGREVGGARDVWLVTFNLRYLRRQRLALGLSEYVHGCKFTLTEEREGPASVNVKNTWEPETPSNGIGICATRRSVASEWSSHRCAYLWGGSRRPRGSSARRWLWFWSSGRCTGTDSRSNPSAPIWRLSEGNDGVLTILTLSGGTYDTEDSSHSLTGSPVKTTLMVLVYTSRGMLLSVHTGDAAQSPSPGWKCTKMPPNRCVPSPVMMFLVPPTLTDSTCSFLSCTHTQKQELKSRTETELTDCKTQSEPSNNLFYQQLQSNSI